MSNDSSSCSKLHLNISKFSTKLPNFLPRPTSISLSFRPLNYFFLRNWKKTIMQHDFLILSLCCALDYPCLCCFFLKSIVTTMILENFSFCSSLDCFPYKVHIIDLQEQNKFISLTHHPMKYKYIHACIHMCEEIP